ncbi:LysR substrate-binding domain-containing protein [uncultured Endozoicomonas sp.]|uniref:LysR substrate-binding domain-containing protein n=1 Tax=uncultured Endozoicomonas sp. TaxID=432652 RepID=UPI00260C2BE3|nr:LysR substrate-binding domain-containing protein [uncultured Endozoicomonas sp.]
MNTLEGITEFVAVAEHNSFTMAGKSLGVSTAQVSRQITQLESRLKTRLFYRTTRKVTPTEEGTLFYQHCRQILDNLDDAERIISNRQESPQGLIKMTAPFAYGEQFIMPVVLEYMALYPQVSVHCELTNQTLDLVHGGYDLAIRLGHLPDSSMIARQLSTRQQHVCASPAYIDKYGQPETLAELSHHNCLTGNYSNWHFVEDGRSRMIKVSGNLQCISGTVLTKAAKQGMGLIQLPGYYIDDAINSGELLTVLDSYREPNQGIWALFPQNRQLSSKIRKLLDLLAERIS